MLPERVTFRGVALGNPLMFSNDEDSFKSLDRWIRDLRALFESRESKKKPRCC